jgi:hypothetical protein
LICVLIGGIASADAPPDELPQQAGTASLSPALPRRWGDDAVGRMAKIADRVRKAAAWCLAVAAEARSGADGLKCRTPPADDVKPATGSAGTGHGRAILSGGSPQSRRHR